VRRRTIVIEKKRGMGARFTKRARIMQVRAVRRAQARVEAGAAEQRDLKPSMLGQGATGIGSKVRIAPRAKKALKARRAG
jgi:hypothetical protein